ncbi:MAG: DUF1648 domain-containing protein [Thermoflexales bacterium]|nr:DUF1648 domain-containing protein [Thermoflexales bacterium]
MNETFPAADARLAFTSGVVVVVLSALLMLVFATLALSATLSFLTFLAAVLAATALVVLVVQLYLLRQVPRHEYVLTPEALIIRFGAIAEVVPLALIQSAYAGADVLNRARVWRYVPLPGWWLGQMTHEEFGRFRMYAVAPLEAQIALITNGDTHYLIAPFDAEGFLAALRQRLAALPTEATTSPQVHRPAWLRSPLWRDRVATGMIAAALLLNLAQFGAAAARYPALPAQVPAHFDAQGKPDRYADKRFVLVLPSFAALSLLVSVLLGLVLYHRQERSAALLMWSIGGIGQVLFAVALLTVGFGASAT